MTSASPYAIERTRSASVSRTVLTTTCRRSHRVRSPRQHRTPEAPLRQLRRHIVAARLEDDGEREREEDEEQYERDRHAEPPALAGSRGLNGGRHGQGRHERHAAARRVP